MLPMMVSLPTFLGLAFFAMLIIFTIYAWMLGYHWFAYGTSKRTSRMSLIFFITGGAILLSVMGVIALGLNSM